MIGGHIFRVSWVNHGVITVDSLPPLEFWGEARPVVFRPDQINGIC